MKMVIKWGNILRIRKAIFICVTLLSAILCESRCFGENANKDKNLIFPEYKSFAELSQSEKKQYLKLIGKNKKKKTGINTSVFDGLGSALKPYEHTQCQIGYLPFSSNPINSNIDIQSAQSITSDPKMTRIDIRLDKLRVYSYPGYGKHQVLLTFQADNGIQQGTSSNKESLSFSQTYEAQDGEGAGVTGYPIFIGLNVGKQGAVFKGSTINVSNDDDEKTLSVINSKAFQGGLSLLTTAQPAIVPLSAMSIGIANIILGSNKNKKMQDCNLGLDFDDGAALGVRLAAGNYLLVQAPDDGFNWQDWGFDVINSKIVNKKTPTNLFKYNYMIFRVAPHVE